MHRSFRLTVAALAAGLAVTSVVRAQESPSAKNAGPAEHGGMMGGTGGGDMGGMMKMMGQMSQMMESCNRMMQTMNDKSGPGRAGENAAPGSKG